MAQLPSVGQQNWGPVLNTYLQTVINPAGGFNTVDTSASLPAANTVEDKTIYFVKNEGRIVAANNTGNTWDVVVDSNKVINSASDPSSPSPGETYFNTTDGQIYYWDGTTWKVLLDGGSPTVGDVTSASNVGTAGIGLFKQKNGGILEFKNIDVASAKLTLNDNTTDNEVELDIDTSQLNTSEFNNDANFLTAVNWGDLGGTLSNQSDLQTALDSKEPTLTAGTNTQYYRGDKTWQTLDKSTVGLGNVTNDAQIPLSQKGVADGVATLGSDSKIPSSQLPALAVTNVSVVADDTARDALTVEEGDVAKVTSSGKTFIYDGSSWVEMTASSDVTSVNGQTGVVTLTTANVSEGTNLYYTETRVSANTDVAANTAARHSAVTLNATATTAGMSISGQDISYQAANASQNGYLTSTDWNTFNNKQSALGFTPENSANKGTSGGYASLDGSGKVPTSQLPNLALTDVYAVADIAARDALTVQSGDVAIVNDDGSGQPKTYIHDGTVWQEMKTPTDAVTSVNGQTGAVSLNSDNISEGSTNLYYTETRVSANTDVAANTTARHTHTNNTTLDAIPDHTSVTTGYVLKKTAGGLDWQVDSAGIPGGADSQIQFNDGGSFAGNANLTWNKTNGYLNVNTGIANKLVSTTTNYTATVNDYSILADATSGNVTITLPAASNAGIVLNIKKIDSSANTVTIDGNGAETIDGVATFVLDNQWQGASLQSDGTNWYIMGGRLGFGV